MNTLIALLMTAVTIPEDAIFVEVNDNDVVAVVGQVEYDLAAMRINLTTDALQECQKDVDRLFGDRFQQELTLSINNSQTVVVTDFTYDVGAGIITVKTREPIFCT